MEAIITLFYIVFCVYVVHPPTEFISAGFTIQQLFEDYLGSENTNFVEYHLKRITITALLHSTLPLGYVLCLWVIDQRGSWLLLVTGSAALIPIVLMWFKAVYRWEKDKSKHPAIQPLNSYTSENRNWRAVACELNEEFLSFDKVSLPLTATSKIIATQNWLIKVSQYSINVVKHIDCQLVATKTDIHRLSVTGEEEVQYINIDVIPSREGVKSFSFRLTTTALRDLEPRLAQPVRMPEHLALIPTLDERFVTIFKQYVEQNPVHYVDQEPETCIGCMENQANVKINKRCLQPPSHLMVQVRAQCVQCDCRVFWCCDCIARWWSSRVQTDTPRERWLSERCTCPMCRAQFCLLDVCPVKFTEEAPPAHANHPQ